jgi:hypothetical protein
MAGLRPPMAKENQMAKRMPKRMAKRKANNSTLLELQADSELTARTLIMLAIDISLLIETIKRIQTQVDALDSKHVLATFRRKNDDV